MNTIFQVPKPVNEPLLDYAPRCQRQGRAADICDAVDLAQDGEGKFRTAGGL
jgi:hypothetical protein